MELVLPTPATYVVAVSGGVDSMALLDMLVKQSGKNYKYIIAHLDHGIREDSSEDRLLVEQTASGYGIPFVYDEAHLGAKTSEAKAREARYKFLNRVVEISGARGIITAHHQDDVLETAIINILRGSGRKGLTSLSSRDDRIRPLLKTPKKDLVKYAKSHKLKWREDSTNQDKTYLRNYVRLNIMPKFDKQARNKLLKLIENTRTTNQELDTLLVKYLDFQSVKDGLSRAWFNDLPHEVAREVMAEWLRSNGTSFDKKTIERLVVAAKVSSPNKSYPVQSGVTMEVSGDRLELISGSNSQK